MPIANLKDVQKSILAAFTNFTNNIPGNITLHFDTDDLTIMFRQIGKNWYYGHLTIYVVNQSQTEELTSWWKQIHPNGEISSQELQPLLFCLLSFQCASSDGRLFSYRVAVKE